MRIALLKKMVFLHFTKTALVIEKDPEEKKYRRKVVKVGIDPHFSYANMLCDVAWARAHGTTQFIIPQTVQQVAQEKQQQVVENGLPGLPENVASMIQTLPEGEVCGRCESYDREKGDWCKERGFIVRAKDPGCLVYMADSYLMR